MGICLLITAILRYPIHMAGHFLKLIASFDTKASVRSQWIIDGQKWNWPPASNKDNGMKWMKYLFAVEKQREIASIFLINHGVQYLCQSTVFVLSFALSTACTACTSSASTGETALTSQTAACVSPFAQPTARTPQLQTVTSKTHRYRGLSDRSRGNKSPKSPKIQQISQFWCQVVHTLRVWNSGSRFHVDPECLLWQETSHCWEIPLPWRQAQQFISQGVLKLTQAQ